jgi:hypothetical protein
LSSEHHVVAGATGVADRETFAADVEARVLGEAVERALDWIRAVVVDDRELLADRRREAERGFQCETGKPDGAARVDLVVARTGGRAVQLDLQDAVVDRAEVEIAARQNT